MTAASNGRSVLIAGGIRGISLVIAKSYLDAGDEASYISGALIPFVGGGSMGH